MIRWGVKKEFSEEIGNSCLISSCVISSTDYIVSSSHRTFFISKSHIKLSLPVAFSAIHFVPEENLVIGATVGMPCIQITTLSNPSQFILQEFMLHQSMVHQIYCSLFSNVLFTIGNEIKVWNFRILKGSTTTFDISHRASFPGSPLCDGMNLVYIDEKRERVFVPHLNGFILYSFDGKVLEKQKKFSRFLFNAVAILPSPRNYPGLDLSYQPFINIFKRLIAVDPLGNIRIWHRSGQHLSTFSNSSYSSTIFFIAFVNSEFVVTVNTNGDISLIDVKTSKQKIVYKIERKPDRADFIAYPEPVLLVIVSRRLYSFRINVLWKLFYRPVESIQSISRICSLSYSARIALLTSDGCIFLVDPNSRFLIGSASTRGCSRPVSFSYERECHETQIIAGMDDSSVHLFDYFNDDWVLKQILPFKSRIVIVGLGTEMLNWIVISCGFFGDVVFYRYGTWEPLSRISLGSKQCDFAFWSRKGNFLVVLCHNRLNVINLLKLKLVYYEPFQRPNCAVFEEGKLIASYDGGSLVIITLDINGITSSTKCNLCHKIIYLHMKYGCHIIVFSDNSITIGKEQNMCMLTIETPFTISAVSFLSSDLDMLVSLDHELMVITREKYCPTLRPSIVPINDIDNDKREPLLVIWPKYEISEKKKKVKHHKFESTKETPEDVLRRIRQKMMEDEENEFQFIIPKDLMNFSPSSFHRPRFHISDQTIQENEEYKQQKKRKHVELIVTEKSNQDEKKPIILKPSEEVLVIDESLCWGTNDDELEAEKLEKLKVQQLLNELDNMIIDGNHQIETSSELSRNGQNLVNTAKFKDDTIVNSEIELPKSILSTSSKLNHNKIMKLGEKKWKSTDNLFIQNDIHNNRNYNTLHNNKTSKSTDMISLENKENMLRKADRQHNESKIKSPRSKSRGRSKFGRSRSSRLSSISGESSYEYLISSRRSFDSNISSNALDFDKNGKNENVDNNLFSNAFDSFERDQMNSLRVSLTLSPTNSQTNSQTNSPTNSNVAVFDETGVFSGGHKSKRKKAPPRLSLASLQDDLFGSSEYASKSEFNGLNDSLIDSNPTNENDHKNSYISINNNNSKNNNNGKNNNNSNKDLQKVHSPIKTSAFYGATTINIPQSNEELNGYSSDQNRKTQPIHFIRNNHNFLSSPIKDENDEIRFNQDRMNQFDGHPNSPLTTMNTSSFGSERENSKNVDKDNKKVAQITKSEKNARKISQAEKAENLFRRSTIKKESDESPQIKEPSNRPLSSRRKKKLLDHQYPLPSDNTKLTVLDSKSAHFYHLYHKEEEEEEKECEIVELQKTNGRVPLINRDALSLYNPLDVPKIIVRVDSSQNRQKNAVQMKIIKKGTLKRKLVIKRQQLMCSEKKGFTHKTQCCNQ